VAVRTRRLLEAVVAVSIVAAVPAAPMASALVVKQVVQMGSGAACSTGTTFCYQPKKATVGSGTKVVWKNPTPAPHTVTRCAGTNCPVSGGTGSDGGLASPVIASGSKYAFVFHGKGTYVYYCTIHGYAVMHGKVVVT
jgi:plastocyanin